MIKCDPRILFVFIVVLSVVDCQRWNTGGGKPTAAAAAAGGGKRIWRGGGYIEEINGKPPMSDVNASSKSQGVRRGGIGAWGYVAITLFVILSGLGIYYTIIFYPIVCKKERMYHVMGSTTV